MSVFDTLPVVASLLVIVASFASPRWTPGQRYTFAVLWSLVAVVIFFNGSSWGRLNGAACLFAAGVVVMSALRMKKATPPAG
jgi:hypothetical protein